MIIHNQILLILWGDMCLRFCITLGNDGKSGGKRQVQPGHVTIAPHKKKTKVKNPKILLLSKY